MFGRDVFTTQSNICDEAFLQKQLTAKNYIADSWLGFKYAYAWVLLLYRIPNYKDFAEFTRKNLPLGLFLVKILFYEFS